MAEIQRIPRTLQDNEAVIKRGLIQVWEVAAALADIREQRQYLEAGFKTFEEYCQERWNFSRQYAASLIQAKEVVENVREQVNKSVDTLSTRVDKLPENEKQARAIRQATKEPAVQAEVWAKAVEDAGGEQPTAPQIREAAAKVTASKTAPPEDEDDEAEDAGPVDEFGKRVPECLGEVFATDSEFGELATLLTTVKKRINALCSGPGGRWLHRQDMLDDLQNLQSAVKFGKPFTECGMCRRDEQKREKCDTCKHRGWVCKRAYEQHDAAGKAWLEGRE